MLFKKLTLLFGITLLLIGCQYEPLDSDIIDNPPITESIKLESYYNQQSGIVFRWGDYRPDGVDSHSTNLGENKGSFAGGQAYHDINKDGFQDILVTYHSDSNEASTNWYLNSGDNVNFNKTNLINSSTIGLSSYKILKTDVNNDNLVDFILLGVDETQPGNYGGNFTVFKQIDNGTFDVIGIEDGFGLWFHTGAAGDLDGDGFVDVVGATYIWLGDGTGNFTNTGISVHDFGVEPALSYEILDINNDGYNDIVVGTQEAGPDMYGSTTSILFGKSTFGEYNVVSMPDTDTVFTLDLEFLDYDNDGDLDILELRGSVTNDGRQSNYSLIHLYINNNFTFTIDNDFYNESQDGAWQHGDTDKNGWSRFKIDDIDNDGIDDIVAENYQDGDYNGLKKIGGEWKKYRF
ncbi:VCBS repeat-containing protein [Flavobacteriaceae bacterium]|nr:VCBS repeat-containing protein [Flavobacteriaceae bacterium]